MSIHVMNFLGDIGPWTAADVAWSLSMAPTDVETIEARICSDGGSVFEGLAAFNLLRAAGKKVVTKNLGMAGSMASILFLAGDERIMCPGSMLFLHNPYGDLPADALASIRENLVDIYSSVSGETKAKVGKMLDEQTYLTAEEAKARGYATAIEAAERLDMKSLGRLNVSAKAPSALRDLVMLARTAGQENPAAGKETVRMDLKQILLLLGLPDTASAEDAVKAIQALQGESIASVEDIEQAVARLSPKVQARYEALKIKAGKSEDAEYNAIFASRPDLFTPALQAKARKWPLDAVREFVAEAGGSPAAPAVPPEGGAPVPPVASGANEKVKSLAKATAMSEEEAKKILDNRNKLRFPPRTTA